VDDDELVQRLKDAVLASLDAERSAILHTRPLPTLTGDAR
jgi:hypothetical protein